LNCGNEKISIQLLDTNGLSVFSDSFTMIASELIIPVQSITPGLYFLRIDTNNESFTRKIIKL